MNDAVKTGKIVKYLVFLFAAAALLIFAGGFKMTLRHSDEISERIKVKTTASHYLPVGNQNAGCSPEFLLYAAAGSNLRPADPALFR